MLYFAASQPTIFLFPKTFLPATGSSGILCRGRYVYSRRSVNEITIMLAGLRFRWCWHAAVLTVDSTFLLAASPHSYLSVVGTFVSWRWCRSEKARTFTGAIRNDDLGNIASSSFALRPIAPALIMVLILSAERDLIHYAARSRPDTSALIARK